MDDDKMLPVLENWEIGLLGGTTVIWATIYNDPRFENGDRIHTSQLYSLKGDLAQTKNTLYALGKPAV